MTRTEWELDYMKLMGDTIWLDETPEERRLERIEENIQWALEGILTQTNRIYKLNELRKNYVPID